MFDFDGMLQALRDPQSMGSYENRLATLGKYRNEISTLLVTLRGAQIIGRNGVANDPPVNCDLCQRELEPDGVFVDGMINDGSLRWSNMCAHCFVPHGAGIGWGAGQFYAHDGREWHCIGGGNPVPFDSEFDD